MSAVTPFLSGHVRTDAKTHRSVVRFDWLAECHRNHAAQLETTIADFTAMRAECSDQKTCDEIDTHVALMRRHIAFLGELAEAYGRAQRGERT